MGRPGPKRTWTDRDLRYAVENNISYAGVIRTLGLVQAGGTQIAVKRRCVELGIPTDHFKGQSYLKGKSHSWGRGRPLEEVLVENSDYATSKLKNRLVRAGLKEDRCEVCGIDSWQGKPISIQIHHVNGVSNDHRIENLLLVCPNCHSQTDSFAGRNIGRRASVLVSSSA